MNQMELQRELLAFDEKISLAKLEESKATVRVRELEYQKARFSLDFFMAGVKQEEAQRKDEEQKKQQEQKQE